MDRLDAMAVFVAVAELQGFAAAARRLRLSTSAVTRLVARLEERLEIRLLQRTTRSVTLTDAGSRYLERARRILAEVEQAEEDARTEHREPTGRFVVAAPMMFGRLHVAPLMSAYLMRYPRVVGELALSDALASIVDESIDVAVRIGPLADSSLLTRKVGVTLFYQVAQAVRDGTLEVVLRDYEPPPLPIQLVHGPGRFTPATLTAFSELVDEVSDWRFV